MCFILDQSYYQDTPSERLILANACLQLSSSEGTTDARDSPSEPASSLVNVIKEVRPFVSDLSILSSIKGGSAAWMKAMGEGNSNFVSLTLTLVSLLPQLIYTSREVFCVRQLT